MSDLRQNLQSEFQDPDYRYAYAESFLNTKIATQIKVLREQRGQTQAELAVLAGTKQAGFSRFEDVNHSGWKTDTLWKIARALGVRVDISFETFGSLVYEKEHFDRPYLERPDFHDDPIFNQKRAATAISWRPGMTLCELDAYVGAGTTVSAGSTIIVGDINRGAPVSVYPVSGGLQVPKKPIVPATSSDSQTLEISHRG